MQRPINSTNIIEFGVTVAVDIYNRQIIFDASSTTFNGAGASNVLGIAFSVEDQDGVQLATIDWNDPQIPAPIVTYTYSLDLSNVSFQFLFQKYKIVAAIRDQDGIVYPLNFPIKSVCMPLGFNEGGYVDGIFDLSVNCTDNVLAVRELTNLSYNKQLPDFTTKNGNLYYPTGTIAAIPFSVTPFSNNQLFTGQYRINCTTISSYDIGDGVSVLINYITDHAFDVVCADKISDISCCIVQLQDQYMTNCNNAKGQYAKQQLDKIQIPLLVGLVKEINGQDASGEAKIIKETLKCNCGKSAIKHNEFNPINPSIYNIVVTGVGGTTVTPTVVGTTKTFTVTSSVYQVVKGDTGDLSYTITPDTSVTNTVKYKLTFNKNIEAGYILTAIAADDALITQLNSLISTTNSQIDLSNLNGRCVIDLSSTDYFLTYKVVSGSNTIKNIVVGANTYTAPSPIAVSNTAAIEAWLNGLSIGTFSVSFSNGVTGAYINILSVANANNLVSVTITTVSDVLVQFQKTNASLIALLQAIIDYLCEITLLQISLGRALSLCYFNYNGALVTQTYSADTKADVFMADLSTTICNLANRINAVTSVTCAKLQQIFVDNSGAQFGVNDRFYGTLVGACAAINRDQAAQAVINAISNNNTLKTAFCSITCADPLPCPDINGLTISYQSGIDIVGLYQVSYTVPVTVNQTSSVRYRLCNTTPWITVTVSLVTLPNGIPAGSSPFVVIPNPIEGACYEVWVQNNCGGIGQVAMISIPANTPIITFVNNINTNVPTNCCPVGYTLTDDESSCFQVDQQPATYTGSSSPITAEHFSLNVYGLDGLVIYKLGGFNVNGTWPLGDSTLYPNIYTARPNTDFPNANTIPYTTGLWRNGTACTLQNGTCGRLNQTGIWKQADQTYTGVLGFSRQINIPTAGVYYVGMGADDYGTIQINGTTIVQQNIAAICGASYLNNPSNDGGFKWWNVYPVQLQAGPNLIQLTVTNTGSEGIMGVEVYDATEAELAAAADAAALAAYTIFSTKDISNGDNFDVGNYNCNDFPGYQLVNDAGTYYCRRVLTTNVIPCGS